MDCIAFRYRFGTVVASLLMMAPAAWAAPDVLVLGDGPPKGRPLPLAQLRTCLNLQPQLVAKSEQVTAEQARIDAARAEFDRFEAQLERQRATLDASDKAAVDAYNAGLAKRRDMVAAYSARLPVFSEQAQAYNVLRQTWANDCDDRPYDMEDYAAIHKAR